MNVMLFIMSIIFYIVAWKLIRTYRSSNLKYEVQFLVLAGIGPSLIVSFIFMVGAFI